MICVPDLARGLDAYTRIGFDIYPGGAHDGRATHNAIAFQQDDYLEILSLRDPSAPVAPGSSDARLAEFLARGGGFRYVAVQSDDLAADVAAVRRGGGDGSEPVPGAGAGAGRARAALAGREPRRRESAADLFHPTPDTARRAATTGGASRGASQRCLAAGPCIHRGVRRRRECCDVRARARDARAEDPARC